MTIQASEEVMLVAVPLSLLEEVPCRLPGLPGWKLPSPLKAHLPLVFCASGRLSSNEAPSDPQQECLVPRGETKARQCLGGLFDESLISSP